MKDFPREKEKKLSIPFAGMPTSKIVNVNSVPEYTRKRQLNSDAKVEVQIKNSCLKY